MNEQTLQSTLDILESGKIKERSEAVKKLYAALGNPETVERWHDNTQGKVWSLIQPAVFAAFGAEKLLCEKKGSLTGALRTGPGAQALTRLGDVAALTRRMTDISRDKLNGKGFNTLLEHLLQGVKYRGQLIEGVSLDYVKAMGSLLGHPPHMARLKEDLWVKLVDLCFNIVLGDPLTTRLEQTPEEDDADQQQPSPATPEDDVDDEDDEMETDEPPSTLHKRRLINVARRRASQPPHVPLRPSGNSAVSQEQREFLNLLRSLLTSPTAPILSNTLPILPAAILNRMRRFLDTYYRNTSVQSDFLQSLASILSCLVLNKRALVVAFARRTWTTLVSMWSVRNVSAREYLATILKILFPYYIVEDRPEPLVASSIADGIKKLWRALEPGENRRSTDALSLDALRLQINPPRHSNQARIAFVAGTFEHGWQFDEKQALAWAMLELQADCTAKLFSMSESVHGDRLDAKRARQEDPISEILHAIPQRLDSNTRIHYLQILLFFVDRHWHLLHVDLQAEVVNALLQFLSYDDASVQSWCFTCLAAIAHTSGNTPGPTPSLPSTSTTTIPWDAVWTHAMRRTNVPAVCRTACHAAHVLLHHAKTLLSPSRMVSEIEAFAKDLDVQGPSFPYDSVCAFVVLCMRIASQDVRLYRMSIEDKALTWVLDNWRPGSTVRTRLPLQTVQDMLYLLCAISGSSKTPDLLCEIPLPEGVVTNTVVEEYATAVIRDFQLHARLPPFDCPTQTTSRHQQEMGQLSHDSSDNMFVTPQSRERRVSSYFLKTLDELAESWTGSHGPFGHVTAESTRTVLDFSIVALCFEGALSLNGTQPNRRTIQAACRVLKLAVPRVSDEHWTVTERTILIAAFEPLIAGSLREPEIPSWEMLLPPGDESGIRREILSSLDVDLRQESQEAEKGRRKLQRAILQSSDVQDMIVEVLRVMRHFLDLVASGSTQVQSVEVGDGDQVRVAQETSSITWNDSSSRRGVIGRAICICISSLATFPVLQSTSGEPTRDKELFDLLIDSDEDAFLILAPEYLRNVKFRTFDMKPSSLMRLLEKLHDMLRTYMFARNADAQMLSVQLLQSTMHVWIPDAATDTSEESLASECGAVSGWLIRSLENIRSWRVRDALARFLDDFVAANPKQSAWVVEDNDAQLPSEVLPVLGSDLDIRVRLRAAVSNTRLLRYAPDFGVQPDLFYTTFRKYLCVSLDGMYEEMLTRFVCLGNCMIANSATRRGPYWHLLELCFYTGDYTTHIEAVLRGVAARLGFTEFRSLFEAYASQIAHSIRQAGKDFLLFPPRLLGYQDRRHCAEATFAAFTPQNLLSFGSPESIANGRRLFKSHCAAIQKTAAEGWRQCFSDVVGYQIVAHVGGSSSADSGVFWSFLERVSDEMGIARPDLKRFIRQHADGITVAIVRTLADQDISADGPVASGLGTSRSPAIKDTFCELTAYRGQDRFRTHEPDLPRAPITVVLAALTWFFSNVGVKEDTALSYHVIRLLFAELDRTYIVNERVRRLNCVCLWVALHVEHVEDPTLLRTLSRSIANLFAQFDLVRGAQSILQWIFPRVREDNGLAELLIRVACAAYDMSLSSAVEFAQTGLEVLEWLEGEIVKLVESAGMRPAVQQALAAWPRDLNDALRSIYQDPTADVLALVLTDKRISSNKFRLVGQLHRLAIQGQYDIDQFARSDFWQLKESIPSTTRLSDRDVSSFIQLLLLYINNFNGLTHDPHPQSTALTDHLSTSGSASDSRTPDYFLAARRAIVTLLLGSLDGASAAKANLAFLTLRSITSVYLDDRPERGKKQFWSSLQQSNLSFIQAFSRPEPVIDVDFPASFAWPQHSELSQDHSKWVQYVAATLSDYLAKDDKFYASLRLILRSDASVAEDILPILVHSALSFEQQKQPQASASEDPRTVRAVLSEYFSNVLSYEKTSTACRLTIITIFLHLRRIKLQKGTDPMSHDKWLQVDFLLLSRNAILCGSYTTALLFLELAREYSQDTTLDPFAMETILYDIYAHIDEPDGFYGIETQDPNQFLLRSFHHEGRWDKAFQFHGAALETSHRSTVETQGMLMALHSIGFDRLAMTTLQHSDLLSDGLEISSLAYQLGWRTAAWDLPERSGDGDPGSSVYLALKAVNRERELAQIYQHTRRGLVHEMQALRALGNENLTGIRDVAQNLMCLEQIRRWLQPDLQQSFYEKLIPAKPAEIFGADVDNMAFSDREAVTATRLSLMRSLRQQEQRDQIGELSTPFTQALLSLEANTLLELAKVARVAGQGQIALNAVIQAQGLPGCGKKIDVTLEYAKVLWMLKEATPAALLLKAQLPLLDEPMVSANTAGVAQKARIYALLGAWAAEACLEKPAYIQSEFFEPAATILKTMGRGQIPASVYQDYAVFAERQYHAMIRSPDNLRWRLLVERKRLEVEHYKAQLQDLGHAHPDYQALAHARRNAEKVLKQDEAQFQAHTSIRYAFLNKAIEMHSRSLASTDKYDDDACIRLCSLWFANFDHEDDDFQSKVAKALHRVPSQKFVFLTHQLSARLSSPVGSSSPDHAYGQNVFSLVLRMCRDHPFHCLYSVFCLNGDNPVTTPQVSNRRVPQASQADRAAAAIEIFTKLQQGSESDAARCAAVQKVCAAARDWAKFSIKASVDRKGGYAPIPAKQDILQLRNIHVPVMTAYTPLDATTKYRDCVWIQRYEPTYSTAGGINLPKIVVCVGTDGRRYKQLFKGEGEDDLRQDAVMEQVFELVNIVLRKDEATMKRNLRLKTYKVIPLSAQAGVLEFVTETIPLQSWLSGAHLKYAPATTGKYVNWRSISTTINNIRNNGDGVRISVYEEICRAWKPVMRHYFTERHKMPMPWFNMRLNYARSVATTSIVGHIIGLGDRHLSNILIHEQTGEIVHIDLGIAFEQGKLLTVPERVPFRLTRDMVDGLGSTGTRGVFQRCAEETLRVMRDGSEVISTVLEVFKYDPLHSWTASELKLKQIQSPQNGQDNVTTEAIRQVTGFDMSGGIADEAADRALSTVMRKLDKTLSVQFTVNELISEATDVSNLALMFSGWSAWC